MKRSISFLFFVTLIAFNLADPCQDNFKLSDFPEGIASDLLSLLRGQSLIFSGCSETVVDARLIKLWYWSRRNLDTPILLNRYNPSQLDVNKPTILLIHGWLCNVTNDRIPELRNAYLKRSDCNVIALDWSSYGTNVYARSFCIVPIIGDIIGEFLCNSKLDLNRVHIVGHAMGAQIAGFIGGVVQSQCKKKISRITGLDPAGPLYQSQSPSKRLDATDATFVDVIHTSGRLMGYDGNCGTIDFYPNCGSSQPGCFDFASIGKVGIQDLPAREANCNQLRSADFMIESINSNAFVGKSSKLAPYVCVKDLFPTTAIMGEGCPSNSHGTYILGTNKQPPYAQN